MAKRGLCIAGALLGATALGGCEFLRLFPVVGDPLPTALPVVTPTPPPTENPTPAPTVPPQVVRTEVMSTLRHAPYLPLFTQRLINDGIGIFAVTGTSSQPGARRWGRDYTDKIADLDEQAQVYVATSGGIQRALVVFRRESAGTWLGDFAWRKTLVRKKFVEEYHREALFEHSGGGWQLGAVSVAIQRPADATVNIAQVHLAGSGFSLQYRTGPHPEDRLLPVGRLASGLPGEPLAVTVKTNRADAAAFVQVGAARHALARGLVDATGARFAGTVPFPDVADLGQIGIDVVATRTLEVVTAAYEATLWGVPVRRKGGSL